LYYAVVFTSLRDAAVLLHGGFNMRRILFSVVLLGLAALGIVSGRQATSKFNKVAVPPTLIIANLYASAGGCQDTGRTERVGIPNFQLLNLTYKDPSFGIAGLSLRETNKVGNSGVRNVKFDPAQGVLTLDIFAGGGGTVQCVPFIGCSCVGASGGSYGTEITAHYNSTNLTLTAE
jgi:hypothetical protein